MADFSWADERPGAAPTAPPADRKRFGWADEQPEPDHNEYLISDAVDLLQRGLYGAIAGAGEFGETYLDAGEDMRDWAQQKADAQLSELSTETLRSYNKPLFGGEGDSFLGEGAMDPRALLSHGIEMVGLMGLPIPGGALVTGGTRVLLGAGRVATHLAKQPQVIAAAAKAGMKPIAYAKQLASKQAPIREAVAKVVGYGGAEAAVGAGSTGIGTREEIMSMSHDHLSLTSAAYNDLIKRGYAPSVARRALAEAGAEDATKFATLPTMALGAGAGIVWDKLLRGLSAKGFAGRVGTGATTEILQEGPQSAFEQVGTNLAVGEFADPDRKMMESVPEAVTAGMFFGGMVGGGIASLTPGAPVREKTLARVEQERSERETAAHVADVAAADNVDDILAAANSADAVEVGPEPEFVGRAAETRAKARIDEIARKLASTPDIGQTGVLVDADVDDPAQLAGGIPGSGSAAEADRATGSGPDADGLAQADARPGSAFDPTHPGGVIPGLPDGAAQDLAAQARAAAVGPKAPASQANRVDVQTDADMDAARLRTNPEPTDAQINAGNYAKGRVRIQGVPIHIETARGAMRRSKPGAAEPWAVRMPVDYGGIEGTTGADGDPIDVSIGPRPAAPTAFVIDQQDPGTGKFDEHKVMLGFPTEAAAREAYSRSFADGKGTERIQGVTPMPVQQAYAWAKTNPKAPAAQAVDAQTVDAGAGRQAEDLEAYAKQEDAKADEWAAKVYKPNKTVVELRGDGPRKDPDMQIGEINENRRRKRVREHRENAARIREFAALSEAEQINKYKRVVADAEKWAPEDLKRFQLESMDQVIEGLLNERLFNMGFLRGAGTPGNVAHRAMALKVARLEKAEAEALLPPMTDKEFEDWVVGIGRAFGANTGAPAPPEAQEFVPTHQLSDGTPVKQTEEEGVYVDVDGSEWEDGDASPIAASGNRAAPEETSGAVDEGANAGGERSSANGSGTAQSGQPEDAGTTDSGDRAAPEAGVGRDAGAGRIARIQAEIKTKKEAIKSFVAKHDQRPFETQDRRDQNLVVSQDPATDQWRITQFDGQDEAVGHTVWKSYADAIDGLVLQYDGSLEDVEFADPAPASEPAGPVDTESKPAKPAAKPEPSKPAKPIPLMEGDRFRTITGRATTPFPKAYKQAARLLKAGREWLKANAIAEAEARGDDFNLIAWKALDPKNWAPADGDAVNLYLFDDETGRIGGRKITYDPAGPVDPKSWQPANPAWEARRKVADTDSLLVAIAKQGGVSREDGETHGFDKGQMNTRGFGVLRVFTKKGMSFDYMREDLAGRGYPGLETEADLADLIHANLNGQTTTFTPAGMEAQADIDADASREQGLDEEAAREQFEQMSSDELWAAFRDEVAADAPNSEAESLALWDALSQDGLPPGAFGAVPASEFGSLEAWLNEQDRGEGVGQEDAGEGRATDDARGQVDSAGTEAQGGDDATDTSLLSSYTEQDLAARAAADKESRAQAARDEAKAAADDQVEGFELTGSDRQADKFGGRQGDLVGTNQGPALEPEPTAPAKPKHVEHTFREGADGSDITSEYNDFQPEVKDQRQRARAFVADYGKRTGNECCVLLDLDGRVFAALTGHHPSQIELSNEFTDRVHNDTDSLELIHNHPGGNALGQADIGVGNRNLKAIEAVSGKTGKTIRAYFTESQKNRYPPAVFGLAAHRAEDAIYDAIRPMVDKAEDATYDAIRPMMDKADDATYDAIRPMVDSYGLVPEMAGKLHHHAWLEALHRLGLLDLKTETDWRTELGADAATVEAFENGIEGAIKPSNRSRPTSSLMIDLDPGYGTEGLARLRKQRDSLKPLAAKDLGARQSMLRANQIIRNAERQSEQKAG